LLIHKNGSTSLENLANSNPERYELHQADFLDRNKIEEVVVFIRDPIERFFSGLKTQMEIYKIPSTVITDIINRDRYITFFDLHTTPQFWVILGLGKRCQIKFKLLPMSELHTVDPTIRHLNKGSSSIRLEPTDEALQRLDHFYTEDIIMYNNFLNRVVSVDDIIEKIKLEKIFVADVAQYKQMLTYLL
jgi:hypothetical protein